MKCHLITSLLLGLLFLPGTVMYSSVYRNRSRIIVKNQEDFDALGGLINDLLLDNRVDIDVTLMPGNYKFHNNHISITGKQYPKASITIHGKRATIIADGSEISQLKSSLYIAGSGYIDSELNDIPNYSRTYQMDGLVEIVDFNNKICRVPCAEIQSSVNLFDWTCAKLELSSWYTGYTYDITSIKDGYIYFKAYNLAKGLYYYGDYNVNYDYTVGKQYPRFRVVNIPIGGCFFASEHNRIKYLKKETIHQCEASRFLTISESKLQSITIKDLQFVGCNILKSLIVFDGVDAKSLRLSKCTFSSMRSSVLNVLATNNVTVDHCSFYDNYATVISIANNSNNAMIHHNRFGSIGMSLKQTFCIICRGGNYNISHNEFKDFNYGAIGVGVWYGDMVNMKPSYGVVENNHIYYTDSFKKEKASWTLIDSGAIYLWTRNSGAIIRNNFIHDYTGMGSNRGIYCDDGVSNSEIYGNIILNIDNCYSIDLRRDPVVDGLDLDIKSNMNNKIFGNTFNNRFRFEGRDGDTSSVKGRNIVLVKDNEEMPNIILNNTVEEESDVVLNYDMKKWYRKGQKLVR